MYTHSQISIPISSPSLTQRDVQHLIVHSSNHSAIQNVDFVTNSAGLRFHPKVGFGLLDAQKLVGMAASWKNVGEQKRCEKTNISSGVVDFSECSEVTKVERVIVKASILHPHRGQVRISLESPQGTQSELLPLRPADATQDLLDWDFVSVHFFGENPRGTWKLHIISEEDVEFRVQLKSFQITG